MDVSEAIREVLRKRGVSQRALAAELGISQPSIQRVLSLGNPRIGTLNRYMGKLGYVVAVVPVGGRLPEGSMVVERGGKQAES